MASGITAPHRSRLRAILFGIDKSSNWTVDSPDYLAPSGQRHRPGPGSTAMYAVESWEICRPDSPWPRSANRRRLVAAWLFGIVINLLTNDTDLLRIVLRDFGRSARRARADPSLVGDLQPTWPGTVSPRCRLESPIRSDGSGEAGKPPRPRPEGRIDRRDALAHARSGVRPLPGRTAGGETIDYVLVAACRRDRRRGRAPGSAVSQTGLPTWYWMLHVSTSTHEVVENRGERWGPRERSTARGRVSSRPSTRRATSTRGSGSTTTRRAPGALTR